MCIVASLFAISKYISLLRIFCSLASILDSIICFTAGMIKADEALQWGLVNYVVEQSELLAKAEEIAGKILNNSSTAIAAAIRSINANYTDGVNGYHVEIEEFGKCFGTEDFKEGTTAFIEKRKANFK